ncbi:MAG: geranylgeranyl pyrophosphate synthase [Egibacteraceae bacterium]
MVDHLGTPAELGEAEVLRRLAVFRGRLGPELGAAFDALEERLELFRGGHGQGYFSHPMALPVLELPQWAAAHTARQGTAVGPAVAADLVEAAAVGYLHVRVQDDWFDEAVGEPGAAMMLSDALCARHQALLARAVPVGSAFWELFEEAWLGYGEAMLLERRLHRGEAAYDAAAFRSVLARSRPLVLSPAAALFAAGRAEDVETLEQFSAALVTAHQLFADLLDAEKDRANGNRTHVLFRLDGRAGGDREAEALRVALFSRGGFDAVVSDALDELARARRAADALAMPEAVRFCEERARLMTELQVKLFEAFFFTTLS